MNAKDFENATREVIRELRHSLRRHAVQRTRPMSCTSAPRTAQAVSNAHQRLARVLAGCKSHMTPEERWWLRLAPALALEYAETLTGVSEGTEEVK